MDLLHTFILIVAGVAGGIISSLVGGAALVTYPALLSVGLPPVTATVCNLVALTPGNFLAALYDRGQLPPLDRAFVGLVVASLVGAGIGAGVGVLLIGVLSIGGGDYRAANTTKNLVTSLNSMVAAALFIVRGAVEWQPTLLMLAGALVGAFIGARLAQIVPHAVMRVVVTLVGGLLTVVFAWRYWV